MTEPHSHVEERTLQYLGPEGCPELAPELLRTAVISSILFQMTQ